ncbi:MAG: Hsp70 family protein [Deltaproteobacteria bacterium]|nr:Hsp70 family protein [Deltaproteobacteria bacterium]
MERLRQALFEIRDKEDSSTVRGSLLKIARELPKTPESLALFRLGFELLSKISDPTERRLATLDYVKELPRGDLFLPFYSIAIDEAVTAADALDERAQRLTELLKIAKDLPGAKELVPNKIRAWRLALGLPDRPRFAKPDMQKIVRELPKSIDETFYRGYTLLGMIKDMPKEGPFLEVYREGIRLAMQGVELLQEPYYKKYAILHITNEIQGVEGCMDLYIETVTEAYKAATDLKDPFARQYAIIEMIQGLPKTPPFFPLIQDALEKSLAFFTVKNWIGDIDPLDVVDFILSAEELGIKESKQKRFSRAKYAATLANELEKFGMQLNDTRFLEVLKPYTHVWVQPKNLRDSVKKIVDHLQSLEKTYHGREIERPVFVKEYNPTSNGHLIHKKEDKDTECIAIDLGATNTVIMRRKTGGGPDFLPLPMISKQYEGAFVIPTVISPETNNIGAEVTDESPIANIKQLLLEGNPKGREHMERFFRILYQHLKKATSSGGGWLSFGPKAITDTVYITVPVGFQDYKTHMKEIAERNVKGTKIEFIEEPLAAAVGYQVIEDRDKVLMLIDFGGSTLNTMVLRLNIKEVHIVSKPERAQLLGGHDIDIWLAKHLASKVGLSEENLPYRLIHKAEHIKIELSKRDDVPFEWEGREVCRVTREEFEKILDKNDFYKFIDRTVSYVLRRADKVGIKKDKIEVVLLTGGSSQIPSFKEKIGHIFPNLRKQNLIYDHSPLSAVGIGAALYATKDITDRHLGMAYAIRYAPNEKETTHSFSIVLEKGETLPLEKTFSMKPARKLGVQNEITLELFEVPEGLIARRWVMEGGIEFLKQELKEHNNLTLNGLKTVTLTYKEPVEAPGEVTICVNESGILSVIYGPDNKVLETEIRLQ